jgi:uncharacterized protein involved in outer membrane biogenesis
MTFRRLLLAVAAALVALPLAVLVAIVVLGVSIDASRWRDSIAARATAALGRPVALEGPIGIVLGRETALRIGGVRILNPPGFATPELATLGDARARIDLRAALRGVLVILSFEAADGRVRLERAADGRANWTAPDGARPPSAADGDSSVPSVAFEVQRTTLRNFGIGYRDQRSGARHFLYLDELAGTGKWSEPLKLTLRGRVDRSFPYTIAIEGGPARLLQEAGEPWPFTLDFEFLGTRLHAAGTVDGGQGTARFEFGAGTEDLLQVERFLDEKLPKFGVAALTGKVLATRDSVEIRELQGVLGASAVAGHLALALGGARRRLTGELEVATLDLRPFLDAAPEKRGEPLTYDELAAQPLALRGLVPVDADLVLRVREWIGVAVDARDARLELHADERGLRVPLAATIAGVPLTGRIDVDAAAAIPTAAIELGARDSPLGGLGRLFTGAEGVDGRLGHFSLRLDGRGETLGAVVRDLEVRLAVAAARLSYGNEPGARPVAFTLDSLDVAIPRAQRLRGTARGTVLGERATAAIRGRDLPHLLREQAMPVEIEIVTPGAKARIEGTLARPEARRGTDLAFRLDARRSGDLARLLGVASESRLPIALAGRARVQRDEWHLDATTLKLGRSELTVDAHRTGIGAKSILVAAVRSPLIDVPELETLRAKPSATSARGGDAAIDVPILPYGIALADADIGLGLDRVVLGRAELVDFGFGARIRDGHLAPSPFAAQLAGVPFEGLLGLDLRSTIPEVSLAMSTGTVDIGALLRRLGVAEDLEASADALQVELIGRGSRLRELVERSSFEARLVGGNLTVRGAARRAVAEIRLKEAVVAGPPGGRIAARVDGALDATPVEIVVWSGTLAEFGRDARRVPFTVRAQAAGTRLALEGEAALPLGSGGQLTLELAGERLDSLSALARADLPPWGPWSIRGPFRMTPTGYEVQRLAVRVGQSRLNGRGQLDVTGARPRLDLRVSAPSIQLDDFPLARNGMAAAAGPADVDALRETARGAASQTQQLLSAEFLRRFDAYVDVTVRQVLSGADRLGDGALRVQLIAGQLYLGPAEVNLPGGTLRLSLAYDPTESLIKFAAGAYLEHFEYGVIARRVRPGSDLAGLLSLNLELTSNTPALSAIMANADGRIDLAVWPRNLGAGQIDLWVVNLFRELLPVLDRRAQSQVNCAVGRFDLRSGVLTRDALVIDTSRMRVLGAGEVDFATEAIDFRFQPRAKDLQFFSLETPVRVTGTLTDFNIGVSPGDVLATIARFFGSVIVVPLETLFRGPIPRDGADVCTDPLRAVGQPRR